MLWYEFSMLWHEISMPCYAMVHVVKDMHGLTVTQHSTYTRHYVHIYKITNTQEFSPPPPPNYYTLCIALLNTLMEKEE